MIDEGEIKNIGKNQITNFSMIIEMEKNKIPDFVLNECIQQKIFVMEIFSNFEFKTEKKIIFERIEKEITKIYEKKEEINKNNFRLNFYDTKNLDLNLKIGNNIFSKISVEEEWKDYFEIEEKYENENNKNSKNEISSEFQRFFDEFCSEKNNKKIDLLVSKNFVVEQNKIVENLNLNNFFNFIIRDFENQNASCLYSNQNCCLYFFDVVNEDSNYSSFSKINLQENNNLNFFLIFVFKNFLKNKKNFLFLQFSEKKNSLNNFFHPNEEKNFQILRNFVYFLNNFSLIENKIKIILCEKENSFYTTNLIEKIIIKNKNFFDSNFQVENTFSHHERILNFLPLFNPFFSQIILNNLTLKSFFSVLKNDFLEKNNKNNNFVSHPVTSIFTENQLKLLILFCEKKIILQNKNNDNINNVVKENKRKIETQKTSKDQKKPKNDEIKILKNNNKNINKNNKNVPPKKSQPKKNFVKVIPPKKTKKLIIKKKGTGSQTFLSWD